MNIKGEIIDAGKFSTVQRSFYSVFSLLDNMLGKQGNIVKSKS